MQICKFGLKELLSLPAFAIVFACASAPSRADVAIEAVWTTPGAADTPYGQKVYVSGTHVRIDSTGHISLVLYDGKTRFAVDSGSKECRAETADSIRQFVQSVSDAIPRTEWKVKSLDQSRDIGQWKCKVYQVSAHRIASKLYPASTEDIPSKEICVVPYGELPNGAEVQRASQAITRFLAPEEPFGDPVGIIEQTSAVSTAVNGFVVALKPFVNGNQDELVVKSWKVEPVAKDMFTAPSGCRAH
jgi:hypothetical protein